MIGIKYIVDSNAWIDYLNASFNGFVDYKSIIELEDILMPTVVIAELKRVYIKNNLTDDKFNEDFKKIKELVNVKILDKIDVKEAIQAGRLRSKLGPIISRTTKEENKKNKGKGKRDISLIDCILLSLAISKEAKVLSKDIDFIILSDPLKYKLPIEVEYLKKYIEAINIIESE